MGRGKSRAFWHDRCMGNVAIARRPQSSHPIEAVMDMFAPEFSRFWLPEAEERGEREVPERRDEDSSRREREALAELAERVSAARSVV
jgi:hypothetical protein